MLNTSKRRKIKIIIAMIDDGDSPFSLGDEDNPSTNRIVRLYQTRQALLDRRLNFAWTVIPKKANLPALTLRSYHYTPTDINSLMAHNFNDTLTVNLGGPRSKKEIKIFKRYNDFFVPAFQNSKKVKTPESYLATIFDRVIKYKIPSKKDQEYDPNFTIIFPHEINGQWIVMKLVIAREGIKLEVKSFKKINIKDEPKSGTTQYKINSLWGKLLKLKAFKNSLESYKKKLKKKISIIEIDPVIKQIYGHETGPRLINHMLGADNNIDDVCALKCSQWRSLVNKKGNFSTEFEEVEDGQTTPRSKDEQVKEKESPPNQKKAGNCKKPQKKGKSKDKNSKKQKSVNEEALAEKSSKDDGSKQPELDVPGVPPKKTSSQNVFERIDYLPSVGKAGVVDHFVSQKFMYRDSSNQEYNLYSFPTIGDGHCFFHAVFTKSGNSDAEIVELSDKRRQHAIERCLQDDYRPQMLHIIYEKYVGLLNNRRGKDHHIFKLLDENYEWGESQALYKVHNLNWEKDGLPDKLQKEPHTINKIEKLFTDEHIRTYLNAEVSGDAHIPFVPTSETFEGTECIIKSLLDGSNINLRIFTFNAGTGMLNLIGEVGQESEVSQESKKNITISILHQGIHYTRLWSSNDEPQKQDVLQVYKNYEIYRCN